ncbi:unnamed protein product [Cyprideis torosa]|uniref:Uncharacterized protein n=1 Tax=Cyprideis torosa TaxID=163714 RepID=A0A7R8WPM8_9CRUS|nr:unnamed protein product [Cyprideis torosa]CAG0905181.1 unnamed protein product [Cyprideis torosa]
MKPALTQNVFVKKAMLQKKKKVAPIILNEPCSLEEARQCYPFDKTFCDMNLAEPKCRCTEGLIQKGGKCENGATSLTGYSLLLALSIMFTQVLA